jgi:hypothetical protein
LGTAAEDIDYRHARGLDKALYQRLLAGLWLSEKQNVLLTGPLEIRAIEVTDNATGDRRMLPCLLNQIAQDESIASVSGNGAYDTKLCHEAIAQRGAEVIIPTRKNAKPWKDQRRCLSAQLHSRHYSPTRSQNMEEVNRLLSTQSG